MALRMAASRLVAGAACMRALRVPAAAAQARVAARTATTFFTPQHEWVRKEDDGSITIGITEYAQEALGEIVWVDLPEVGSDFEQGDDFGSIESVKAASEVYAPVACSCTAINSELEANPGLVNASPEAEGWLLKATISDASDLDGLLDAAKYKELLESERDE